MRDNNLKGLWIPYGILTNEKLSDKEKYIYSIILFFSKNTGYCTISNKYLAILVNLSDTRVSKIVSSLSNKKYIQVITHFQDTTKQVINRKIITLVKYDYSKMTSSIVDNDKKYGQKDTNIMVENDKYKNNKKYNNYKNIGRKYTEEFLESLYIN